jgi:hypothetical protein
MFADIALQAHSTIFVQEPEKRLPHESLFLQATCRIRTNDPEITNHVLWPTELRWRAICIINILNCFVYYFL